MSEDAIIENMPDDFALLLDACFAYALESDDLGFFSNGENIESIMLARQDAVRAIEIFADGDCVAFTSEGCEGIPLAGFADFSAPGDTALRLLAVLGERITPEVTAALYGDERESIH